ncbi:MAG: hypothetical protein J6B39_04715 [Lachnospiraceae bacterium]|nr:hypothetical protein [Lachnospiraceae bacterium]
MPKEKKNKNEEGSRAGSAFMTLLIVLIWLGVIIILIKLDVGGLGNKVLRPVIGDIPILKEILPDMTDDDLLADGIYPFSNLAEATAYYEASQAEIIALKAEKETQATKIAELEAEVARLKFFEDDQLKYNTLWKEFHDKVVYAEQAPELEAYIAWYETIDPTYAEKLYRQAVDQVAYTNAVNDFAKAYSSMKPASAAKILVEMTGNLDTVALILSSMKEADRADILGEIAKLDAVYAAKITVLMEPEE